ncbi:SOS response-associated peptidase family protein [Pseudarthrobacter sp. So.54]
MLPHPGKRLYEDTVDRRILIARWGLVPPWARDIKIGARLINARSESILDKPSFRRVNKAGLLGQLNGRPGYAALHGYGVIDAPMVVTRWFAVVRPATCGNGWQGRVPGISRVLCVRWLSAKR